MTATATATAKPVKLVQIVARYTFKRNGHVVYQVRSSNGLDLYCTTIINGKATGCTCPSIKPCYHMKQLEAIEARRMAQAKQQAEQAPEFDAEYEAWKKEMGLDKPLTREEYRREFHPEYY